VNRNEFDGYMGVALAQARLALCEGEVPVGAALFSPQGSLLSQAHNRCEALSDPTAHAEMLCIREGAALRAGRLDGCTLFVTLEPCAMCAGALVASRLSRLVFGAFDPVAGCCGSVFDLTDHCFLHSVEVWGGILEDECLSSLKKFFNEKRRG
jgi:tRNA(adenine34) deaminase